MSPLHSSATSRNRCWPPLSTRSARRSNFAPFALRFVGLGLFPGRGAPRVIWLGTTTGSEAASAVHRVAAERLRDAGVELERRPFHPHVTLARWRGARAADARRVLAADNGREIAAVRVDHVTLFESRQQRDGAAYRAVARAPCLRPYDSLSCLSSLSPRTPSGRFRSRCCSPAAGAPICGGSAAGTSAPRTCCALRLTAGVLVADPRHRQRRGERLAGAGAQRQPSAPQRRGWRRSSATSIRSGCASAAAKASRPRAASSPS